MSVQSSSLWQCGGDKTELHKAECGPELRPAMTKAQEPGNWHNCPITICHLYIQGESEITAKHCKKQRHTKFYCRKMNDRNTESANLEVKFSDTKTFQV